MSASAPKAARRGRTRDPNIDARILAVASRHLARHGYEALSVAAVAQDAGTTRQALYRRWPTKVSLATAAALHTSADPQTRPAAAAQQHPLAALTAELAHFQRGVSRPGRLSLVGTMLQDNTDAGLRARYQEKVVAPRRRRIRDILERAQQLGLVEPNADLDVAVTMCTGSWYARALSGAAPPPGWPARTATLIWRALGGTPPETQQSGSR